MSKIEIKYTQKLTLRDRDGVQSRAPRPIDGTLLVGDVRAIGYEDDHGRAGHDWVELYPAFHCGAQAWLMRRDWCPAFGYSGGGEVESILSFADGVSILAARGVYSLTAPAGALAAEVAS